MVFSSAPIYGYVALLASPSISVSYGAPRGAAIKSPSPIEAPARCKSVADTKLTAFDTELASLGATLV